MPLMEKMKEKLTELLKDINESERPHVMEIILQQAEEVVSQYKARAAQVKATPLKLSRETISAVHQSGREIDEKIQLILRCDAFLKQCESQEGDMPEEEFELFDQLSQAVWQLKSKIVKASRHLRHPDHIFEPEEP